jgi:hypothetical protein
VYPSQYPYKPSTPVLRFVERTTTATGGLNGLSVLFAYPSYNGNADKYECEIFYTPVGSFGANWYNIFDASNGIADTSFNNLILSNGKIVTPSAVAGTEQRINVVCRTTVLAYGIRIRILGRKNDITNYPYTLYSDYSDVDYIEI